MTGSEAFNQTTRSFSSAAMRQWGGGAALAAATVLAMSLSVWIIKREAVRRFEKSLAETRTETQGAALERVEGLFKSLDGFAKSLSEMKTISRDEFRTRAAAYLPQNALFSSINYVDRDYKVAEVYPFLYNRAAVGQDLKSRFDVLPAAHQAVAERAVVPTGRVDLLQGGQGVIFYAPIVKENSWSGLVEAVIKDEDLPGLFGDKKFLENFSVSVLDQSTGQELFRPAGAAPGATPFDAYFPIRIGPRTWWVILQPLSYPFVLVPLVLVLLLELAAGALLFHQWVLKKPRRA